MRTIKKSVARANQPTPTYVDGYNVLHAGEMKSGGWIAKASASIKRRGTEGKCTPMSKPGCSGRAKALAKTFHKIAKRRKGK